MTRFLSFLYGLVAYVIFLGAFLYAIAFVSGSPLPLALPKTIDIGPASPVVEATIVNLLLMSLFAIARRRNPACRVRSRRHGGGGRRERLRSGGPPTSPVPSRRGVHAA